MTRETILGYFLLSQRNAAGTLTQLTTMENVEGGYPMIVHWHLRLFIFRIYKLTSLVS